MKKGFTLIEIVVVLAIIGIAIGLFYSIFYLNWSSFEKQLALVDLGQEADKIMEMISLDGRLVTNIQVSEGNKITTLTLMDLEGNIIDIITYTITEKGQIQRNEEVLSENIEFDDSLFRRVGSSLVVELLLQDYVFGQDVQLPIETQIFPRNSAQL